MAEFKYAPMFQLGEDTTEYYKLTSEGVSVGEFEGHEILKVTPEALTMLSNAAFRDVNFLLRPAHNEQVAKILSDPEASDNDKYVALMFLRNAEVAAKDEVIKRLNDAISEEQRRKMATAEKSSAVGDCAKLREALATIRKRLVATYESEACFMRYSPNKPLVDLIDAALAAPPRNCEMGTIKEQSQRFNAFCDAHKYVGDDGANWCSMTCPCYNDIDCGVKWAQMPYESEAEK